MRKFNTVDEWLDWQQTVHPLNIDFKLERILGVYKKLNISKIANKIITVAGTNGKGSTVSFLESVRVLAVCCLLFLRILGSCLESVARHLSACAGCRCIASDCIFLLVLVKPLKEFQSK